MSTSTATICRMMYLGNSMRGLSRNTHFDVGSIGEFQRGPQPLHIEPGAMVWTDIEPTLCERRFAVLLDAGDDGQT